MTSAQLAHAIRLHRAGELRQAQRLYQEIVNSDPGCADAWHLLGQIELGEKQHDEAVRCIQKAIQLQPGAPALYTTLGAAYRASGRLRDALAAYQRAVALAPMDAKAWHGIGLIRYAQQQYDEARGCFQRAIKLDPNFVRAHSDLGVTYQDAGEVDEAVNHFRRAIELQPLDAVAHLNLGKAYNLLGRLDLAENSLQTALRLKSDLAEAHFGLGCLWLLKGELERGWPGYAWRSKVWKLTPLMGSQPEWDGSPFPGKAILLYAEQGLGDTIQFVRYLPLVKERGGRVIFACKSKLHALLGQVPGVDELIALESLAAVQPQYDLYARLLDLPRMFHTSLETIPRQVPYVHAQEQRIEHWGERLSARPGFKVGIAWQGNAMFRADRLRSIPLAEFAPLAAVPGVCLVSLQKGLGTEQISAAPFGIWDFAAELDSSGDAFLDTAALMTRLDLIVTSDTSIAHLAGALGVPVWVALTVARDWRWMLRREDSPWYPTMRLFRQTSLGDWASVFSRIAEEVQRKLG